MTSHARSNAALVLASLSFATVVGVGGTAIAADGGPIVLGQANTATKSTTLTSSGTDGPALKVRSAAARPAASFFTQAGVAPFSVTSGTKVANLGADTLDGLDSTQFLRADASPVTAEVFGSSTETAPTAANKVLAADGENYDPSDMHAGSDATVVAPKEGTYVASAVIDWDAREGGYRRSSIMVNTGATVGSVAGPALPAPAFTSQNVFGIVHLRAGQSVRVEVLQGSGSDLGVRLNRLQLTYVGP